MHAQFDQYDEPYVFDDNRVDLKRLMEAYGEDVWQYAYFLTKKQDMADDIAQDVFLKAYHGIGSFRGEATLKTWLLKITRNTAFSYRRRAYFRYNLLMRSVEPHERHPSAEHEALENEFSHEIWHLVLQLPAKYREAIILSAHYQLTLEEMSHTLQIPLGTVKTRIHRARKALMKLTEEGMFHA